MSDFLRIKVMAKKQCRPGFQPFVDATLNRGLEQVGRRYNDPYLAHELEGVLYDAHRTKPTIKAWLDDLPSAFHSEYEWLKELMEVVERCETEFYAEHPADASKGQGEIHWFRAGTGFWKNLSFQAI